MAAEVTTGEKHARGVALCRGKAERWRREAGNVRDHATLLRSADHCDDEAAYWEAGARDYET